MPCRIYQKESVQLKTRILIVGITYTDFSNMGSQTRLLGESLIVFFCFALQCLQDELESILLECIVNLNQTSFSVFQPMYFPKP